MSNEWYITRDQQKTGPFSSTQLRQLASSGQLIPTDELWKQGMTSRVPASKVSGLFAAVETTSAAPTATPIQQAPSPPSPTSTNPAPVGSSFFDRAKSSAADFASHAKAAAQLTAKQAERSKLIQLVLPGAYAELGKQVHAADKFRREFEGPFKAIDKMLGDIRGIEAHAANQANPQSLADKAKSAAGAAKDLAHVKALQLRARQDYAELGKGVFEKYADQAGSTVAVKHVRDSLARKSVLDSEIAQLSEAKPGQWLTPKRIAVAAGVLILVLCLGIVGKNSDEASKKDSSVITAPGLQTPRSKVSAPGLQTPKSKLSSDMQTGYEKGFKLGQHLVSEYESARLHHGRQTVESLRTFIIEKQLEPSERNRDEMIQSYGEDHPQVQWNIGYCMGFRAALTKGGVLP